MIKVLFVVSNLIPQGPIKQLFYLCKNLDKKKIEPFIVTTSQKCFDKTMHKEFTDISVKIFDLNLDRIKSVLTARGKIQFIIDNYGINIIQSYGFRSDIISSSLKRTFKITSVRNTLLYNYKMAYGLIPGFFLGHINLHFVKKFDKVIACSQSVSNYLKTLKLESKVITNAIDTKVTESYNNISDICLKTEVQKGALRFLTVSSRYKGKNIEFLLKAFSTHELASHTLIVAGYVHPRHIEKYTSFKNIQFIGHVNNLSEHIIASNYFISASLHEGMPNAVLEAMSLGKPVLLSNIPSHQEIFDIIQMPIGAIFINNDLIDLFTRIESVINSNYEELSFTCKLTIKNFFSAISMAKQYESLYVNIIEKINDVRFKA